MGDKGVLLWLVGVVCSGGGEMDLQPKTLMPFFSWLFPSLFEVNRGLRFELKHQTNRKEAKGPRTHQERFSEPLQGDVFLAIVSG